MPHPELAGCGLRRRHDAHDAHDDDGDATHDVHDAYAVTGALLGLLVVEKATHLLGPLRANPETLALGVVQRLPEQTVEHQA